MRDPNNPCLFCNINSKDLVFDNAFAFASFDSYPVSKYHSLIVPKRHILDYFELTNDELLACNDLIKKLKNHLSTQLTNQLNFLLYVLVFFLLLMS